MEPAAKTTALILAMAFRGLKTHVVRKIRDITVKTDLEKKPLQTVYSVFKNIRRFGRKKKKK